MAVSDTLGALEKPLALGGGGEAGPLAAESSQVGGEIDSGAA